MSRLPYILLTILIVVVSVATLDVLGALADDQSSLALVFDSRRTPDYGVDVDYGSIPAILMSIIRDESSSTVLPDGLGLDGDEDLHSLIPEVQQQAAELSNGGGSGCNGVGNSTCLGKDNCQGVGNANCTANGDGHENGNDKDKVKDKVHDKDKDKDNGKDKDKTKPK